MPRPSLPPTPQTWPDLSSDKDSSAIPNIDGSFNLPPSAMNDHSSAGHSRVSPTSQSKTQSRSQDTAAADATSHNVSLPPPPMRSRKIIQVTPGAQPVKQESAVEEPQAPPTTTKRGGGGGAKGQGSNSTGGGRKKQNAGTSAGRKIARKTAHSLIERRRRSKMNEEFATLKDMIPACKGQEMHKLAILQASIDYLRYLEKCVAELKAKHDAPADASPASSSSIQGQIKPEPVDVDYSDEEMVDPDRHPTPIAEDAISRIPSLSSISSSTGFTSPAFSAHSAGPWQSSRAGDVGLPSPAFDAQYNSRHYHHQHRGHRNSSLSSYNSTTPPWNSNHPSPMILPQSQQDPDRITKDLDHEASAALLMLNAVDRRISISGGSGGSGGSASQNGSNTNGGSSNGHGSAGSLRRSADGAALPPSPSVAAKNAKVRGLSVNDLLRP